MHLCFRCIKHCLEVQGAECCEVFYGIFEPRVVLRTSIGNSVLAFLFPSTNMVRWYSEVLLEGLEQGVGGQVPLDQSRKFTHSLIQESHFYV